MNKTKYDVNAIALDDAGRVILSDERLRFLEQASDVVTAGGTNETECVNESVDCGSTNEWNCEPSNGDCTNLPCMDTFCPTINTFWCS